jgi:hypothetical protein
MKMYHLGLILFGLVLILTIISSYKNKNENFDIDKHREDYKKILKKKEKYWKNKLHPSVENTNGEHLKIRVVEGNTNMSDSVVKTKVINPSVSSIELSSYEKQINKCERYNVSDDADCSLLASNDCGYCVDTDKISAYDSKTKGPLGEVCINSKWKQGDGRSKNQGDWVSPGPKAVYFCTKKKEQRICARMKNCGDNIPKDENGKSYPNVKCAWCPATGKGVPAKIGEDGGLVPKYDDDKCKWAEEWKNKRYPTTVKKFLGWSPDKGGKPKRGKLNSDGSMTPAAKPYGAPLDTGEGDCDRDEDCGYNSSGQPLKCGHDGRNVKRIVGADGKELKPNQGYKDYCYDPNQWPFKGSLIEPKDCAKFNQMFPCVSKNMMTGPHSDACLEDLWRSSGCTGGVFDRATNEQKKLWNSNGYIAVGNNMNNIRKVAKTSRDYKKANDANKKCFNTEFSPCLNRFIPRPKECAQKLYNETGCKDSGKLNPKNISGPNSYVTSNWINGQNGGMTKEDYKKNILSEKVNSRTGLISPKWDNFDKTIDSNLKCFGKIPGIPFDKPCWKDFTLMMKCMKGVKVLNIGTDFDSLSFDGASNFHNLLALGQPNKKYWKNEYTWTSNSRSKYILTNNVYQKTHFPFWNFLNISKNYWKNNWAEFSSKLEKSRFISKEPEIAEAKWYNWKPKNKYPLKKGEGDCDRDSHCAPGLKCAHNPRQLLGVSDPGNVMRGGRDFCYDPLDTSLQRGEALKFMPGSNMAYIPGTTSRERAENEGTFIISDKNFYLTKKAYQTEDFPYWLFLNAAEKLGF